VEKDKRTKLQPKVERTIYLGLSPAHSNDTYKLMRIGTNSIIYRRNVYFNERSFPARKLKLPPTLTSIDDGSELIGLEFEDDNQRWTVTKVGFHDDHPILYYTNNRTGEEERSSVAEVRTWYNRTTLKQAISHITPTRKGYINSIAEESYKAITYDVSSLPTPQNQQALRKQATPPIPNGSGQKTKKDKDS
jgi:hypothetical protein